MSVTVTDLDLHIHSVLLVSYIWVTIRIQPETLFEAVFCKTGNIEREQ